MSLVGSWAVPVIIAAILLLGMVRRVGVFDTFLEGAAGGVKVLVSIVPSLIGLIVAVQMLTASGGLDLITHWLSPAAAWLRMPADVMPLALLRPISGGGSIALLDKIFQQSGPDSLSGRIASTMCGSSETTFYTTTVYFGAVGVKKIRHTIAAALLSDFASVIFSTLIVRVLFS